MDGLSRRRIEVDMIKFSGPVFAGVDNRLMSLQLVENSLTDAAMFTAAGEVVQLSEVLYGKRVLIERGSFRPFTNVSLDMVARAEHELDQENPGHGDDRVVLMEMTLNNLMSAQTIDHQDFLNRVDLLGALGKTVMVSNYTRFGSVTGYLRKSTKDWIAMVVGVPTFNELLEDKYYADLPVGLQGIAGLFRGQSNFWTRQGWRHRQVLIRLDRGAGRHRKLYSICGTTARSWRSRISAAQLHITPGRCPRKIGQRLLVEGDGAPPVAEIIEQVTL